MSSENRTKTDRRVCLLRVDRFWSRLLTTYSKKVIGPFCLVIFCMVHIVLRGVSPLRHARDEFYVLHASLLGGGGGLATALMSTYPPVLINTPLHITDQTC